MTVAYLRCDTFCVYLIDAEQHLGLPSLIDVHGLDDVNIKERFQLPKIPLTSSVCSTGYWIVRVTFFFTFDWLINILIDYSLQSLVHLSTFVSLESCLPFHSSTER